MKKFILPSMYIFQNQEKRHLRGNSQVMQFQVAGKLVALYSTQKHTRLLGDQQILPEWFWNTQAKIGGSSKTIKHQQ